MAIVYLSIGSNFGDRIGYVQQAVSLLGSDAFISIIQTSSFYETEPWGMETDNWFVNAVIEIKTDYTPIELFEVCQNVEKLLGRIQHDSSKYEDRTVDIDILFYNKEIIDDGELVIPHKFMHLRAFTLVPMLEINEDFIHPVLNKSMIDLHSDLENPETVYLYGTRI